MSTATPATPLDAQVTHSGKPSTNTQHDVKTGEKIVWDWEYEGCISFRRKAIILRSERAEQHTDTPDELDICMGWNLTANPVEQFR